jgi:hypothetical protein
MLWTGGSTPLGAFEPLVTHGGVGTVLHPIQKPDPLPFPSGCCKDHVYIFGINGLNPLCLGNFNGLCSYLREQGFEKTYFEQMYTCFGLERRIRHIYQEDPQARIVIIGFSLACQNARNLANALARDGTRVDLLVYIAGDFIDNSPRSHPPNVGRVLNIRARGLVLIGGDLLFNGADIDGARNHKLTVRHILSASNRETLTMLMEELRDLACGTAPVATPPATAASPVLVAPPVTMPALTPTAVAFPL